MAKILILNGSPRKNGATASLMKALIEGAKENGNEIKIGLHYLDEHQSLYRLRLMYADTSGMRAEK